MSICGEPHIDLSIVPTAAAWGDAPQIMIGRRVLTPPCEGGKARMSSAKEFRRNAAQCQQACGNQPLRIRPGAMVELAEILVGSR
jgi:hypothetical protein